jgi:hypothetical protein
LSYIIRTPVIGIPSSPWQKKAWKYAKKNPNFVKVDVKDFCYECSRHRELLSLIDEECEDFTSSEYWRYYKGKKSKEAVLFKIEKYKETYKGIRKNGYISAGKGNSSIIVTDDGCRLDGSHRAAILLHLNIPEAEINIFIYERCFSKEESKRLRKQNKIYRKKIYNLD